MLSVSLIMFALCCCGFALIAYDCENTNNTITTISVRDVEQCPSQEEEYKTEKVNVQIVQRNDIRLQEVKTCLVEITRIISYCGMHSHTSAVAGGLSSYIYPLGEEECRQTHRHRSVQIYRKKIYEIKINGTTSTSITLEGTLKDDGSCQGVTYIEENHSWSDVVVYATVKIDLRSYWARVKMESNEISLSGGILCPYLSGYCIDSTYGETIWDFTSQDSCHKNFSLLYDGKAEIVTHSKSGKIIVVEQGDKIFALSLIKVIALCGVEVWQSEHPKVLVVEKQTYNQFQSEMSVTTENTDLTVYVNSKLFYIEQAYKRAINALYVDTVYRRCLAHREILKNRLLLAPLTPNSVSAVIKNQLGYIGRVLGEVLYVMKCTPRVVQIRRTENCYHELPITVNNQSLFMSPLTHLIQKYAEQVECSAVTPPLYFIDGKWIGLIPHPVMQDAPTLLAVEEEPNLHFKPIQPLGSSGLYTQEEVLKVQKALTFGMERSAVSNIILRKIAGRDTDDQGYSTLHLFDKEEIKKLADSTLRYIWGWFTDVGTVMSGFIGFYFILRLIKYTAGVFLNGIAIYRAAGCGVAILASLWNTLSMLFLHQHEKKHQSTDVEKQQDDNQTLTDSDRPPTITQSTSTLYPVVTHWTERPDTTNTLRS